MTQIERTCRILLSRARHLSSCTQINIKISKLLSYFGNGYNLHRFTRIRKLTLTIHSGAFSYFKKGVQTRSPLLNESLTIPRFVNTDNDAGFNDNLTYFASITNPYFGGQSLFHKSSSHILPYLPLLTLKDILKQFNLFTRIQHLKLQDSSCNLKYPYHSPLNGPNYFQDPDQFPPNRNNAARIMSYMPKLDTFHYLESLRIFKLPISYTITNNTKLNQLKRLSLIGISINLNFFEIINKNLPKLINIHFHNVSVHLLNLEKKKNEKLDINDLVNRLEKITIIDDNENMHRGIYELLINTKEIKKESASPNSTKNNKLYQCFEYEQDDENNININIQKERQTLKVIHYHPTKMEKGVSKYMESMIFTQLNKLCLNLCFNNYCSVAKLIQNSPQLTDICFNIDKSMWSNINYDASFAQFMHSFMQKTSIRNIKIKEDLFNNLSHSHIDNKVESKLIDVLLKYMKENSNNNTLFSLDTFVYITSKRLSTIDRETVNQQQSLPPRPSALNFLYGSPHPLLQKIQTTNDDKQDLNFDDMKEFLLMDKFSKIVDAFCMVRFDQINPSQFQEIKEKFVTSSQAKKYKIKICGDKEYLYDEKNENHYESCLIKVKLLYFKNDQLYLNKFGDFEQWDFQCPLI